MARISEAFLKIIDVYEEKQFTKEPVRGLRDSLQEPFVVHSFN